MSYEIVAYHTCEDRGDGDRIEREGPYKSFGKKRQQNLSETFLSPGYYFWEDGIASAHWWGNKHCQPAYAILECTIELNRKKLLDLAGNPSDKHKLVQMAELAITRGIPGYTNSSGIPVGALLDFIIGSNPSAFPFDAARVNDCTHAPGGGRPQTRQLSTRFDTYTYTDECQYILCIFQHVGRHIISQKLVHPKEYTYE